MEMDKRDINPLWWLWLRLGASQILILKMFEWLKFVEICVVQVLRFIEDEQCFNTLTCNWLNTRLNLCVRMFLRSFFILKTFPFDESL